MSTRSVRRSNRDRTEATRAALLEASRTLFLTQGYAATGTPEIVAAAGVTRGALYHHFNGKEGLFRAVVERESAAVAATIVRAADPSSTPLDALLRGGEAYLRAMAEPGRTRLLLLDGPAVLGRETMDAIDAANAGRTLYQGISTAIHAGALPALPVGALTAVLAAGFDRAALAIAAGADPESFQCALAALLRGLTDVAQRG